MESKVYLKAKFNGKKTICDDVFFTPPYKIISPLYNKNEAEIVIMSSSAGLLKGDIVDMEFDILENTNIRISSQSFEKIFNTMDGKVIKNVKITAKSGSFIKFMPYPTIPFENSNYQNKVIVDLEENCRFYYGDVFNCGRVHSGEKFKLKNFENFLRVNVNNLPVFIDNTMINPTLWNYDEIGLWQGYTHSGLLYIYGNDEILDEIRVLGEKMLSNCEFGVSLCKKGICVRVLGDNGDKIYNFFDKISKFK